MRKIIFCLTSLMVVAMVIGFSIGVVQARSCILPDFDVSNFSSPQNNLYFPRVLDTTYVYEAETEDELILNVIYISNDTKTILGVVCTVIYDVEWVYVEEEDQWYMTEMTKDWHAWDNFGNFWYFGEWTTEFEYDEEWVLIGCNNDGSWEAGVEGALPGIIVPVNPTPGTCYQQEYYEDEAEDRGKVLRLNAKVSVAYENSDFEDCLAMKEFTKLEPGNIEHKYYAPGVGLVFIEELKEKTVIVELVDKYSGPPPSGVPSDPPVCP